MATDTKRFVDDGWAVWVEGNYKTAVYFTEWIDPKGENYVDIGLWIYDMETLKNAHIFAPFPAEFSDVRDLSLTLFSENSGRAVFNTAVRAERGSSERVSRFTYDGQEVALLHITEETLGVEAVGGGTLFTARLDSLTAEIDRTEIYILFRLPHKNLNEMFKRRPESALGKDSLKELVTSPMVTQRFGYSLRVNEERVLPPEIAKTKCLREQNLRKVLLSLMIDEEYELNDGNCYRIRRLEADAYDGYAPTEFKTGDSIGYQWKETRDGTKKSHYSFFTAIQNTFISRKSVFLYGLILMFTSVLGSAAYDLIRFLIGLL